MNPTPKSVLFNFINRAEESNKELNHENLGFLSLSSGFMPQLKPLDTLPQALSAWDEIASQLPTLFKEQKVCETINQLHDLSIEAHALEDKYLLRAATILSFLAHAYIRCHKTPEVAVPATVMNPWKIISAKLNRPAPFMSYIDLIVYNYKLIDPTKKFEVENLNLLIPIIGNQEERIFYLVQTAILNRSTTILQEIVNIHNAMLLEDNASIESSLGIIEKCLKEITYKVFPKINPNITSKTYVDPVIWAKTVAPFAVPIHKDTQGPSGTSSPMFHMLDVFFERHLYESELGKEALLIREWYPKNWRGLLEIMGNVSFKEYMDKVNGDSLKEAYTKVLNSYSGDNGFLGIHKRKVYSYLQVAFKVGRSVTIGGFQGAFNDRAWEEVDDALIESKSERNTATSSGCPFAHGTKPIVQ